MNAVQCDDNKSDQPPTGVLHDQENFVSGRWVRSLSKHFNSLRFGGNEMVPSVQIPEDILQYIFTLLAHDPTRLIDGWDSMLICQVCCRWRLIAMSTGAVWSNIVIFYTSKERVEKYLTLSKNAKLVVTIKDLRLTAENTDETQAMFLSLALHRERITELKIFGSFEGTWGNIFALVEDLAPNRLQRLDVQVASCRPKAIQRLFRTGYIVPTQELSDKLLTSTLLTSINLSSLVLESLPIEKIPVLQNLTELSFEDCIFHFSRLPDLLQKCPNLQILTKNECRAVNAIWPTDKVDLPHLRHLSLQRMEIGDIINHLRHLTIPPTSHLTIECNPDQAGVDTFDGLDFQLLLRKQSYCETLDVGIFGNELFFESTSVIGTIREDTSKKYVKDSLLLHWDREVCASLMHNWITEFIWRSNWKTASRAQFRVTADSKITEQMWTDILQNFPEITFLGATIMSNGPDSLLRALRRRGTSDTSDSGLTADKIDLNSGGFMTCPLLQHLSFRYVAYDADRFLEMKRTLTVRKTYERPVESFWLYDVMSMEDDVAQANEKDFAELVGHFHCERYIFDHGSEENDLSDSDVRDDDGEESDDEEDDDIDVDGDEDEDEDALGDFKNCEDYSNSEYSFEEPEAEFTDSE